MANRAGIPSSVWEEHKAFIQDLYINKNLKLSDVDKEMRKRGFRASKQQYTRQFQKWGLFKDLKEDEWRLIGRKVNERKPKLSAVFVRGREISKEKLDRGLRRHVPLSLTYARPALEERDYIRVCTPVHISDATPNELVVPAPQTIRQEVPTISPESGELPTLQMADLLDKKCKLLECQLYHF